jgi:uncharacterized protein GlcG (DUF336 family)
MRAVIDMDTAIADAALAAAVAHAHAIGVPVNVALVDASASLKAFLRMDGALLGSIDIALRKARTAALFGMNTETLGEYAAPGGGSPGLEQSNGGLVIFAGGIPLRGRDGRLLGAVGVSGGSVAQDFEIASAAAKAADSLQEEPQTWSIDMPAPAASGPSSPRPLSP